MDAYKGYALSYIWRSIWGARSLLVEGLGWRIGNSTTVDAIHDKWVPFEMSVGCPNLTVVLDSTIREADLIDFNRGKWDINVLSQLFDGDTISAILSIPLSSNWSHDSLYWWLTKNGVYTVKSGYWLGLLGVPCHNSDPNDKFLRKFWVMLWNIPAPPKLRHFL